MLLKIIILLGVIIQQYLSSESPQIEAIQNDRIIKIIGSATHTAWTRQRIYQFSSIYYAKSTRFMTAEFLDLSGIINATIYGPACPSSSYKFENREKFSENCLHLSVYTKNFSNIGPKFPVIFFIHGGYFDSGSAEDYKPDYLLEKDVVLVVPQFRLGILGFFTNLTKKLQGNQGINDVILALKWIKKNISLFGGDPGNITFVGHTGGAVIGDLLYRSGLAKGLFHKMHLISGAIGSLWAWDSMAKENSIEIIQMMGCQDMSTQNDCLKILDMEFIMEKYKQYKEIDKGNLLHNHGGNKIVYYKEGGLIDEVLSVYFDRIDSNNTIPILAGVTKHGGIEILQDIFEFCLKVIKDNSDRTEMDNSEIFKIILNSLSLDSNRHVLTDTDIAESYGIQTNSSYKKVIHSLVDIFSAVHVKGPVLASVKNYAKLNSGSTFLYTFNHLRTEMDLEKHHRLPISNGIGIDYDLQFVFPRSGKQLQNESVRIAEKMIEIWTSFAKYGYPIVENDIHLIGMETPLGPYFRIEDDLTIREKFTTEFNVTLNDFINGNDMMIF